MTAAYEIRFHCSDKFGREVVNVKEEFFNLSQDEKKAILSELLKFCQVEIEKINEGE